MKSTTMIPLPKTLRPEVLSDGRYVIRATSPRGDCLVAYDPVNQVAGVFHDGLAMWKLWTPLTFAELLGALQEQRFVLPVGDDLKAWLDAVAELAGATRQ